MHIHLEGPSLTTCPQCKEKKLSHAVCKECGYYKGREVVDVLKKEKEGKSKEKSKKEEDKDEKPLTMDGLSKKEK